LTPAQWREADADDRAMMTAFELFEGTCESYREQWSRDYHEKKGKTGRSGANEFSQMKKEMGLE
jgi:hypothetical protein